MIRNNDNINENVNNNENDNFNENENVNENKYENENENVINNENDNDNDSVNNNDDDNICVQYLQWIEWSLCVHFSLTNHTVQFALGTHAQTQAKVQE